MRDGFFTASRIPQPSPRRGLTLESQEVQMIFIAILGLFAVAVVQASFFEWAFHRYWLHRPWLPKDCFTTHTLIHHQLCKFDDTFHVEEEEQHEALSFAWWGGPTLCAINLAPWLLVAAGLSLAGVALPYLALLTTLGLTYLLYYAGYEGLHYLMHKPSVPFIERSAYFNFIKRHHRIHHVRMDRNLNVLIPIADWVLGTLVLEMPPAPAHTPEGARKLARRHSRYGRTITSTQDRP
jgi:hypothetical protein